MRSTYSWPKTATVVVRFGYALLGSSALCCSKDGWKVGIMAKRSIHQPQSNYSDWPFLLFVGFVGLVGLGTVVSFFFLPFFGLVEEPRAKVEVISTTGPAVETNITTPPTEAVVERLVASATNKEPSDITFSVRLRLADGETNKNK